MQARSCITLRLQLFLIQERGTRHGRNVRFDDRSNRGHYKPRLERDPPTIRVGRSSTLDDQLLSHLRV
jgi:hypothetical protein